MVNWEDPTTVTIASLFISILIYAVILYSLQPDCIMIVNPQGHKQVSNKILLSISITFALSTAIAVLLYKTHESKPVNTYNRNKFY